ncbi:MAG: ankyrin repeat protein [Hyphomicrobiaceae bacterium]|jgi:ankyrin repeat protein
MRTIRVRPFLLPAVLSMLLAGCPASTPDKPAVNLQNAAGTADFANIEANLAAGVDVNERGRSGATAVHAAAWSDHPEIVRLLVSKGAKPDLVDEKDYTPLCYAAQNGFPRVAEALLEAGADVNFQNQYGWAAIHSAASQGKVELLGILLDAGAEVQVRDGFGKSPLHMAVKSHETTEDKLKIAALLIERGADVNRKDRSGRTPLAEANSKSQDAALSEFLKSKGGTE